MYNISSSVQIHQLDVNGVEISYYYHNDKLFFLYEVENIDSIDKYFAFQTEISSPTTQDDIIKELKLTKKDTVNSYSHIDAFLWDLYIVIIHVPKSANDFITAEKINEIQRNKFVARKIIIQENSKDLVEKVLNKLIFDKAEFTRHITNVKTILTNDEDAILKNIINDSEGKIENAIKEKLIITEDLKMKDISKYLVELQSEYDN